jgi:hypothetical protein
MTISYVQPATAVATASPAVTGAFAADTTAGNIIVVGIVNDSGSSTNVTGVTDNKGNVYTKVLSINSPALALWYTKIVTGGSGHTVSVAWQTPGGTNLAVIAQEHTGITATAPLGVFTSAGATGVTASSGTTASTTVANALVVVVAGGASATPTTITAGSGYGNLTALAGAGANIGMCSKVVSSAGTQSGTMPLSVSQPWRCCIVTFYETNAVAGPSVATRTGAVLVM